MQVVTREGSGKCDPSESDKGLRKHASGVRWKTQKAGVANRPPAEGSLQGRAGTTDTQ